MTQCGCGKGCGAGAWRVLHEDEPVQGDDAAVLERPEESFGGGGNKIVCRACGQRVTSAGARIQVQGKHEHVFFNPFGQVFEVGCFSFAQGLVTGGMASAEFTWFPGYTWQNVGCASCGSHLGWSYTGSGGGGFYGLVLTALREVAEEEE
ncbi:cereblon family protein [Desulfobaculum senezii]